VPPAGTRTTGGGGAWTVKAPGRTPPSAVVRHLAGPPWQEVLPGWVAVV
jgi:hypothetical protein